MNNDLSQAAIAAAEVDESTKPKQFPANVSQIASHSALQGSLNSSDLLPKARVKKVVKKKKKQP